MSNLIIKDEFKEKKYEIALKRDEEGGIILTINKHRVLWLEEVGDTLELMVSYEFERKEDHDTLFVVSKENY